MQRAVRRRRVARRWTVYLVRCADGSLYCGITTDIAKRIAAHNVGDGARYTRSRRPVLLAWSEGSLTESAARKREAAVKNLTKQEKERLAA